MKIKSVVCTSIGKVRDKNQDNFYLNGHINKKARKSMTKSRIATSKEQVLAVFDGMGGEQAGEVASYIASQKVFAYCQKYSSLLEKFDEHANKATQSANNALCQYMLSENISMGSTLAMLCISPEKKEAVTANVGDSKVYLFRENSTVQLSEDHNQAAHLVKTGVITKEEARNHRDKNKLTQYLGIFQEDLIIEPYVSDHVMLQTGDIFIICSDGLTDMLADETIAEILKKRISLKTKAKQLIAQANLAGGKDNITVLLTSVR